MTKILRRTNQLYGYLSLPIIVSSKQYLAVRFLLLPLSAYGRGLSTEGGIRVHLRSCGTRVE